MDVVKKMPYNLKVDRQGRIVLPMEVRRSLGVVKGGKITLDKKNNRLFINVGGELQGKVDQWKKTLKAVKVEAKGFEPGESKWVSEDWAQRKLGIQA